MDLSRTLRNFGKALKKHSPEILTGIGIAGMATATVMAVKATPKALKDIDIAKEEVGGDLTKKEVVKATWKRYVPAAASGIGGAACLIFASRTNYKRNAALSAAYTLSQKTLADFSEAVRETVSEKDFEDIHKKVAIKEMDDNPIPQTAMYMLDANETMFFEPISGQYFLSTIEKIQSARNDINKRMLNENYVSVEEWLFEINAKPWFMGSQMGWNSERGLLEISLTPTLTENNKVVIVIGYNEYPPSNDYQGERY